MATTVGQMKAIIRQKFDTAESRCHSAHVAKVNALKNANDELLRRESESYAYWLGKRAILSELLTSIDEV